MDTSNVGTPAPTPSDSRSASGPGPDFIRNIVADDLRRGKHDVVVTRFPPEPNGYLHIGHATSVVLNFGVANETGGRCHLRFDDTNPETEDMVYVESAIDTVRWLGYEWGEHLYFASDYFERMYAFAEHLIREGKAYVDSLNEEEIREHRGTVTEAGRASPYRDRSVEENLDLFRRMRAGEFPDGAHVLRAKLDMASPNMLLRDPILYRIRHAEHYRSGDEWCIYPLYDFAHPIEDAIESITHSFCTLEFENNRPLYDWVVENVPRGGEVGIPEESRPRQYEFARRNFEYTVTSKRKLLQLVKEGRVSGWDDPRMPTLAGLRRRGFTPESIRSFCETIGVARTANRVDIGKLEFAIRDDLNTRAPRVLAVLDPLRVVITNFPEGETEWLDAPYYPHDVPKEGSRELPFSRVLHIDRDDFREDPPKGYHRLSPGAEVRLRYAYIVRCDEVVRDESGEIVELRCSYDPATRGGRAGGRNIRGTIQWVSAEHSLPCEVRLYDRLFSVPDPDEAEGDYRDYLNPDSLIVKREARVEPSVGEDAPGSRYQFERLGYFFSDPIDSRPGALVFNRTVTLRDTWARTREEQERKELEAAARQEAERREEKARKRREERTETGERAERRAAVVPEPRDPALQARQERFISEFALTAEEAEILTREAAIADLFEGAVAAGATSRGAANWLIHELPREARGTPTAELPVTAAALGELVRLVEADTISSSGGREVLAVMVAEGGAPEEIVDRLGVRQVSDRGALEPLVTAVVSENADKAAAYRAGKVGLMGFFMGQVMRRSGGSANPELAKAMLEERLGSD